jgi:hypothetical protein
MIAMVTLPADHPQELHYRIASWKLTAAPHGQQAGGMAGAMAEPGSKN